MLTHKDEDYSSPMTYIFQLLNHKEIREPVSNAIMEMVQTLFNPEDGEENTTVKPLTTSCTIQLTAELPTGLYILCLKLLITIYVMQLAPELIYKFYVYFSKQDINC